jgi:hypothetical protein
MRMAASWFGSLDPPDTRLRRGSPAPESGLPSDRRLDQRKRAVVLEAVKVWPGNGAARRKAGATAKLDSSCARRPEHRSCRDEGTIPRSNKEADQSKVREDARYAETT